MKISNTQQQKMLVELEEFFSVVPRNNENQKVTITFPDKVINEKTVLRIQIDAPHKDSLEMMSMSAYQIKEVKKITKLKMRSVNAFVFSKTKHTQFVAMFE
tara:strand:- start:566 stop:868 length:303 start_codon:yes stop_codon:yes gene_type:complete